MSNATGVAAFEEESSWVRRVVVLVIGLLVVGGAAAGIYYYFFRDDSAVSTAATQTDTKVTKGQLVTSFSTTGTANASLTSKVTFASGGQLKSISVAVGDKVTAGQELARLDDKDVQRQIQTADINLTTAKLRLQQLQQGPTDDAVASAKQSIVSAQNSISSAQNSVITAQNGVATAQANLDKALAGPSAIDIQTADNAVLSAQAQVDSANNSVQTGWTALINAQKNYCTSTQALTVEPCWETDIPLSQANVNALNDYIRAPGSAPGQVLTSVTNAQAFLQANTTYVNAKNGVGTAQNNLDLAKAKRKALNDPPDAATLQQLRSALASAQGQVTSAQGSVVAAQAGLESAQAKYDALFKPATTTDIALQQQSVKSAQIAYDAAVDSLNNLVLKAPFDGTVGAVGANAGDQVAASTAVVTLSNTNAIRVDLTVSETDIGSAKAGQYAVATFDALPGQTFLLKITGVSNVATVTQGVVTYPVQAQLLRGPDIQANTADLQKVVSAIASLAGRTTTSAATTGGGGAGGFQGGAGGAGGPGGFQGGAGGGGGFQGGAGGGGGFQGGAGGQGGTGAQGGQQGQGATRTPGAQGGQGGQGGQGASLAQFLANQTLPSPGMTASVSVLIDVKDNVLLLPSTAVKRQGRTSYVFIPGPDGKPQQQTVTVGGSDGTSTIISSGVDEGQVVLLGVTTATGTNATPRAAATRPPTPAGGVR